MGHDTPDQFVHNKQRKREKEREREYPTSMILSSALCKANSQKLLLASNTLIYNTKISARRDFNPSSLSKFLLLVRLSMQSKCDMFQVLTY